MLVLSLRIRFTRNAEFERGFCDDFTFPSFTRFGGSLLTTPCLSQSTGGLLALDTAYTNQSTATLDPVLAAVYLPELKASSQTNLVDQLKGALTVRSSASGAGATDASIAAAFDTWVDITRSPGALKVSSADISQERFFLSHFAPHFFPRNTNGTVSAYLAPAEAIYILDLLIAQGGCPHRNQAPAPDGKFVYDSTSDPNE